MNDDLQTRRVFLLALSFMLLLGLVLWPNVGFSDWLTLPANYSHADNGQRVAQYAPVQAPAIPHAPPIRTSGYTHFRSTLAYGQSADNYHRVEQWGDPVRPYGEWRFPFRPYSTPYANWGAPYAGLNIGIGGFGVPSTGVAPWGYGQRPGNANTTTDAMLPRPSTNQSNGVGNQGPLRGQGAPLGTPNPAARTNSFAPYPSGRGTPYPVAPYYDGYHPNYRD